MTDAWIQTWYPSRHTTEYYSATKRNKTGSFAVTWMDLESVIQTGESQKEKNKCIYYHIYVGSRQMTQTNLFAGQV